MWHEVAELNHVLKLKGKKQEVTSSWLLVLVPRLERDSVGWTRAGHNGFIGLTAALRLNLDRTQLNQ